ncbi:unnamed protein product [Durusdinium trenchii]|uniref:O-fucosyltransferase family protein n=1 Tax=Durusdinium trenchii TaxID=1381693 RepID=A0ABP0LIK6_9DINO
MGPGDLRGDLERAKRLLHRLGLRRPKLLLWRVEEHWDGQGLSDRRACLAIILAEAFLLNRIAVLPRFTLSAQHNGGRQLLSNLLEYVSLEHFPMQFLEEYKWGQDTVLLDHEDFLEVGGILDPDGWRRCSAPVLLRTAARQGFWKSPVHPSVWRLAAELHGTGMAPTRGLFAPAPRVARAASAARAALQGVGSTKEGYVGVHCRRGDKLKMMPGLEDVTSPAGLLKFLQAVASHTRRVYLATDEVHVKDYAEVLAAGGFECYTRDFLYDFASEKELQDNYFLFAIEMKIIDDATITVRSFNDATPFWFSADARSAKPCYHLLDRSMHDYLLGSSALGTHMTPRCTAPIDLTTSPETLYRVLMSGDDVPRSPTTVPRRRRKEAPPPTAIALEGRGGVRRPCSVWPLGAADSNDARYEAEVEIVGPWDDTEGMLIWGSYFGPLFSCCDAVDGLTRRSTLFGFENLSMEHCKLTECEIARKTGAVFIYVSCGATTLTDQYGVLELHAGQYGVTMAPVHLCLAKGTRLVAIHSEPFTALRSFGGPVEPQGRLRYVDGCSVPHTGERRSPGRADGKKCSEARSAEEWGEDPQGMGGWEYLRMHLESGPSFGLMME